MRKPFLTKSSTGIPTMQTQLNQLEQDGYTVIPAFLDHDTTSRIRAHMDSLLPPVTPKEDADAKRVHDLRHPIPGAIMAEIVANPRLLELAQKILYTNDLRLLEQVLIRTDPKEGVPAPAGGWHIDMAFLPEHYNARPRQTYFHMVHALNTIPPDGGATTIIPGSHHKTYAASQKLGSMDALTELKHNPVEVAGIDLNDAIEVLPNEGDLLIFNPMCLHSASANLSDSPRYVYFASFMDDSAGDLKDYLKAVNYQRAFPDSLRDNLPANLRSLLDES